MAKITPPPDHHIAALEQRKVVEQHNVMMPGAGTPWEDRGHLGAIKALFATWNMSVLSPLKLLHAIRRPETKSDVRSFAIWCGAMWSLSVFVHAMLLHLMRQRRDEETLEGFWLVVGIAVVLTPAVVLGLLELASLVFHKLNAMEPHYRTPAVLGFNVMGYNLGTSLLAPVPLVGPPLVVAWVVVLTVTGARSRMRLGLGAAVINTLVTSIVVLVAVASALLLARLLIVLMFGYSPV
jgi:hypothetical protein